MQATLTRGGSSLVLVLAMGLVLLASDSLVLTPTGTLQPSAVAGETFVLPDHMARPVPRNIVRGIKPESIIPLGRTRISVPILMYHYVQNLPSYFDQLTYNLTVTPADFNRQLDWLSTHGYHSVTFDDLRAYFLGERPLPSKPVVITLDDGYRDLYTEAYPILEAHEFKAVAYIVTGFVGRPRYVTTDMILQMDHDGFEIASHTVDHGNLARMSLASITWEVTASKQWLERLLGHPVLDFAYPSGQYNQTAENEVAAAGYSTAVIEYKGTYHTWAGRFAWARVRVYGGELLSDFIAYLGPVEPFIVVTPPRT